MAGRNFLKRSIIKPTGHIICTLTISGLLYLILKSSAAFFVSLSAGILIDIDHILDYYIQQGITLKVNKIYFWCLENKFRLLILFFHSLELIFLFWVTILLFKLGIFWVAFAIGLTQHMVLDILFNNRDIYPRSYFLTFRIIKRFKREELLRKN